MSNLIKFFKGLNWKQHTAFGVVFSLCYAICYYLTVTNPTTFSQSCLGMLDNGPLIYLGMLGMNPEGPLMKGFSNLHCSGNWMGWLKNPLFLTVFISAVVNTITDTFGAAGDPTSSVLGVSFGCLIVISILPIVWRLRTLDH